MKRNILTKLLSVTLSLSLLIGGAPLTVLANSNTDELTNGMLVNNDELLVQDQDNTRTVLDKETGESATVVFDDENKKSGIIYFPDGGSAYIEVTSDGNIIMDGKEIVSLVESKVEPQRSRAAGWTYVTTNYYKFNVYKKSSEARSVIWAALALIPQLGTYAKVALVMEQLYRLGAVEGYTKVVNYVSTDYRQYRNDVYIYQYYRSY